MINATSESPNPYTSPESSPAECTCEILRPLRDYCRVNITGNAYVPCHLEFDDSGLKLKFLCQEFFVPLAKIKELSSQCEGNHPRGDGSSHLEVTHSEGLVPSPICIRSLNRSDWYGAMEACGIATYDTCGIRHASQLTGRLWFLLEHAEPLFWLGWVLLIVVGGPLIGLIAFLIEKTK